MLLTCFLIAVQVVLIIKIWTMTNDIRNIRKQFNENQAEDQRIIAAQLKALDGKTEEAYELYKQAYYYSIVVLFNEIEKKHSDDIKSKKHAWEQGFKHIAQYYSEQLTHLGDYTLPENQPDTYEKISSQISKL